ncbi:hypothetical protein MAR_007762 [Mya arenaria]|uniref:Uncharacterized protein n=1 Tax=Mya arenaria TaxID=6604 RepID=A0ABY7DYH6_MYAAR|nr:uncharacterized protein LOC128230603 [Mya arenaria]WAR01204.1 hypothetical protein MAR_007762 [Mya arenaria]
MRPPVVVFVIFGVAFALDDGYRSFERTGGESFLQNDEDKPRGDEHNKRSVGWHYDYAIARHPPRHHNIDKQREDTREPDALNNDVDIDGNIGRMLNNKHDDNIVIDDMETEFITPIPFISAINVDIEDVQPTSETTDDEEITSGSGSGEYLLVEDATNKYNSTNGDNDDWIIRDEETTNISLDTKDVSMPPICNEQSTSWSSWSPWIDLGNHDVRLRRCHGSTKFTSYADSCHGDAVEIRNCIRSNGRTCRMETGSLMEEFRTQCLGLDLDDLRNMDNIWNPDSMDDDCEFTLYDLKYQIAIGETLTSRQLYDADPFLWCFSKDKHISFHTQKHRCKNLLLAFCNDHSPCDSPPESREIPSGVAGLKKTCWKSFVMGGKLPEGLPVANGQQLLCQRFGKDSLFGKAFGHKDIHYTTLYSTNLRMPIISMTTARSFGDEKWPSAPLMLERGLIQQQTSNVISWIFKDNKKGIAPITEIDNQCVILSSCILGTHQATPADFEHAGYEPTPLLPPELAGSNLEAQVSTFAITNTIPLDPTVAPLWKNVIKGVRNYASSSCNIPYRSYGRNSEEDVQDMPAMHLISGAVVGKDVRVKVIGNDVAVPEMIWMAACCSHGEKIQSFGVYTYNSFGQKPAFVSLDKLQLLLQRLYFNNDDAINIELFPAFERVCKDLDNDVSHYVNI